MDKLDKLDKVVYVPDTTFFGAYYYDGKDIDLCDDEDKDENDKEPSVVHVTDKIIDGILYKDKTLEVTMKDGRVIKEISHKELPLNKGDMLIYVMYEGFVQTKTKLITIDQAIERLSLLKSPVKGEE